jgi:hypothetical protein
VEGAGGDRGARLQLAPNKSTPSEQRPAAVTSPKPVASHGANPLPTEVPTAASTPAPKDDVPACRETETVVITEFKESALRLHQIRLDGTLVRTLFEQNEQTVTTPDIARFYDPGCRRFPVTWRSNDERRGDVGSRERDGRWTLERLGDAHGSRLRIVPAATVALSPSWRREG